jgi:tetratricopeptide (TPR) repeat protein
MNAMQIWRRMRRRGRAEPAEGQPRSVAAAGTPKDPATAALQSHPDLLASWLPRRRTDLLAACAVAALAFLAFGNSLWNGFAFDDVTMIWENSAIRNLSDLPAVFASGYWPERQDLAYRPLIIFSYALNYAAAGLAPFTYHLVNVLIHAGNSALVYRLTVALFNARGLAFATAAAFALHPIHTEAVANTVGRAELLANAFLLLSWYWYLKWDQPPARAKTCWLVASIAAFGLAIFTKEHAVILLGLLVMTDLLRTSDRGVSLGRTVWDKCRRAYVWYLLPLAGYLVARFFVLGGLLSTLAGWLTNPLIYTDPWTRSLTAIKILGKYLWLLLVPVRLSADYSYNQIPLSRSALEPAVLVSLMAFLLMLGLAGWSWRRRPVISCAIAILVVTILPVSNLLFPIGTIMAERVLYLPSLGFCLFLAVAVTTLTARPRWGLPVAAAFGLLLLGYTERTVVRNWDWRSNAALFAATVRTSPDSAPAHAVLADILLKRGDLPGAGREYERSLQVYPNYGKALTGLGVVFERQGQIDEAIRVYRMVEKGDRHYDRAHLNLGFLALRQGRPSEASTEFREVAGVRFLRATESSELAEGFFRLGSLDEAQATLETARQRLPNIFFIRRNLALVYSHKGRREDALREMEAAASLRPDLPEVQLDLGKMYAQRGFLAAAESALKAALSLRPRDPDALYLLGVVLVQQARPREAEELLLTAIQLRPGDAEAHFTLGNIYVTTGRLPEAQQELEAALRLKPQYPLAHRALGRLLQRQGRSAEAQREFQAADRQEQSLRSAGATGPGR